MVDRNNKGNRRVFGFKRNSLREIIITKRKKYIENGQSLPSETISITSSL